MALGDGVRRNIRTVTSEERERFTRALLLLQERSASGEPGWASAVEIDAAAVRHRGASFLPWHRELCRRLELMLRAIDPELSLHYWDWNHDPAELFTPGFFEPGPAAAPFEGLTCGQAWGPDDADIVGAASFAAMRRLLVSKLDAAQAVYFGGDHISLHDPLGLLLRSNADRLYAMWQAEEDATWRLAPDQIYGEDHHELAASLVDPWVAPVPATRLRLADKPQPPRTYVHPTGVAPPCYDTLPISVSVDQGTNPRSAINFNDVYRGKTFARAASFRVHGRGNVTFEVVSGPTGPYSVITPGGAVVAPHPASLYQEVRIWFGFTGGVAFTTAPVGTAIIRCNETGQEFVFTLHANTIPVPAAGVVLTLDDAADRTEAAQRANWAGVTWTWTWRPA